MPPVLEEGDKLMRKEKQFIPLTLDSNGKTFYSESTWIAVIVLAGLGLLIAGSFAAMWWQYRYVDFRGTIVFLIATQVLNFLLWTTLIRIFPLKERVLRKIYAETKEHRVTDISIFWGIYNVENKVIYFVDGRCGVLVKATRGYLFGRPEGFEEEHFDKLSRFMRHILLGDYTIKYYNRMVSDANIEPLNETERLISKNRTAGIYYLESTVIKFFRELAQWIADIENEYWLIGCNCVERLPDMLIRVDQALEMLDGSIYPDAHLAEETEIYEFIQQYFGLTYINVQNLIKITFKNRSKPMIEVLDILYADQDTEELRSKIESDEHYVVDTQAEDMQLFERLQEENREARESEYRDKLYRVLEDRGLKPEKLSKRKLKKLEKTVTEEELSKAEQKLNAERLSSIYNDIPNDDEML